MWLGLALAIVTGSWMMDRLPHLQANPYSAPGLVPGVLGVAIAVMAAVMIGRALHQGALAQARIPAVNWREHWRLAVTLVLCLAFALGLVASGLPFWLASALFIAVFVMVFRYEEYRSSGTLLRGAASSIAFGLISGLVIFYVFQELFLVRLP